MPYTGFVRTKLERDNIVKYVEKILDKATHYGLHPWQRKDKQASQRAYESLREIAFKPRTPSVQASEPSD
jgi:hypothetical protein